MGLKYHAKPLLYRLHFKDGGRWHVVEGVYTKSEAEGLRAEYRHWLRLEELETHIVPAAGEEFNRPFEGLRQSTREGG